MAKPKSYDYNEQVGSSFVGFQGSPWICCHIDELRSSGEGELTIDAAQNIPISCLFYGGEIKDGFLQQSNDPKEKLQIKREESSEVSEDDAIISVKSEEQSESESTKLEEYEQEELVQSISESEEEKKEVNKDDRKTIKEDMVVVDVEDENYELFESEQHEIYSTAVVVQLKGIQDADHFEDESTPSPGKSPTYGGKESQRFTQCSRLYGCIHTATSRLQDLKLQHAKKRIELLLIIIPKTVTYPLGMLHP